MPKFNWDQFLGSAADTGIEAFKASSQAGALKREADRREAATAFDMGEKLPIIFGGGGGLGGMAKGQVNAQAGVPTLPDETPTDYGSYDTAGGIGAAPEVPATPSLGDAASRQEVGGATAQAGGGGQGFNSDEAVAKYISGLHPERRKELDAGIEAAASKTRQKDVDDGVGDLNVALQQARKLKVGIEASQKVVQMNEVQISHLAQALDALYAQRRGAPGEQQAEIGKNIQSVAARIEALHSEAQKARTNLSEIRQAWDVAAGEVDRRGKYLEGIGVEPDLVENYGRTFMDNGDINSARRLIAIRAGRGVGIKPPSKSGVGPGRSSQGTARPLR